MGELDFLPVSSMLRFVDASDPKMESVCIQPFKGFKLRLFQARNTNPSTSISAAAA